MLLAGLAALWPCRTLAASSAPAPAIEALLREQGLAGASWALLDPQHGLRTGAAGFARLQPAEPMRAAHRVQVGSVTKTLVALGVLRLVSEGRLALDQPVAPLLQGLKLDNPWQATDPVRLRHLLDHTAGLDDARLSQLMSERARSDSPLLQAFERDGNLLRLRSRPGSRCSYSNMGYTLLGLLIEKITGQRYEAWLDQALLAPLGLHDSSLRFISQTGPAADRRLAMGHLDDGRAAPSVPMWLRPAVQFTTTAADMGRLAQFLLRGDGRVAGRPFIDPALLQAMGRPQGTEAARAGLPVGYGLGLALRDRHGRVGRCHGGNTLGWRAMFCLFPEDGSAFFVAVNTDSESADPGRLDQLLIQALPPATAAASGAASRTAAGAAASAPASAPAFDARPWLGWHAPAPNRFASLAWLDRLFGAARLEAEAGGALRWRPLQGPAVPLQPLGSGLYRAPGRQLASHVLLRDAAGRPVLSTGLQSHARVALAGQLALWGSAAAGAIGLLWIAVRSLGSAGRRWVHAGWPAARAAAARRSATAWPAASLPGAGLLLLAAGLPLFAAQSFLALGDPTPASLWLAAATALLPALLLAGLLRVWRQRVGAAGAARLDALAMLALLQALGVLAVWGLWPLRLWM